MDNERQIVLAHKRNLNLFISFLQNGLIKLVDILDKIWQKCVNKRGTFRAVFAFCLFWGIFKCKLSSLSRQFCWQLYSSLPYNGDSWEFNVFESVQILLIKPWKAYLNPKNAIQNATPCRSSRRVKSTWLIVYLQKNEVNPNRLRALETGFSDGLSFSYLHSDPLRARTLKDKDARVQNRRCRKDTATGSTHLFGNHRRMAKPTSHRRSKHNKRCAHRMGSIIVLRWVRHTAEPILVLVGIIIHERRSQRSPKQNNQQQTNASHHPASKHLFCLNKRYGCQCVGECV